MVLQKLRTEVRRSDSRNGYWEGKEGVLINKQLTGRSDYIHNVAQSRAIKGRRIIAEDVRSGSDVDLIYISGCP